VTAQNINYFLNGDYSTTAIMARTAQHKLADFQDVTAVASVV
jgi:hypothetical protein